MSLLKLRILPDPMLRQKAKKVKRIDSSLQKLIDDMIETMPYEGGIGLAANQVGVLQKVAVIQLSADEDAIVLINPEVINQSGEREVQEGCLSIPGYRGELIRSETIRVKALDRTGKEIKISASELLAQALEHEIDHLNGILYIDHIQNPDKLYKIEAEYQQPTETSIR